MCLARWRQIFLSSQGRARFVSGSDLPCCEVRFLFLFSCRLCRSPIMDSPADLSSSEDRSTPCSRKFFFCTFLLSSCFAFARKSFLTVTNSFAEGESRQVSSSSSRRFRFALCEDIQLLREVGLHDRPFKFGTNIWEAVAKKMTGRLEGKSAQTLRKCVVHLVELHKQGQATSLKQ